MKIKLTEKLTAKIFMELYNCQEVTAKKLIKDIKKEYKLRIPLVYHYYKYYKIDTIII